MQYKKYGRIFVSYSHDADQLYDYLKSIDEYEMTYYPENLIAVNNTLDITKRELVYLHKFDRFSPEDIYAICFKLGIRVWVVDNRQDEYDMPEILVPAVEDVMESEQPQPHSNIIT